MFSAFTFAYWIYLLFQLGQKIKNKLLISTNELHGIVHISILALTLFIYVLNFLCNKNPSFFDGNINFLIGNEVIFTICAVLNATYHVRTARVQSIQYKVSIYTVYYIIIFIYYL